MIIAGVVGIGRADDEVGRAILIDIARAGDREAELVVLGVADDGVNDLSGSPGVDENFAGVAAVVIAIGRADDEVIPLIAIEVADVCGSAAEVIAALFAHGCGNARN